MSVQDTNNPAIPNPTASAPVQAGQLQDVSQAVANTNQNQAYLSGNAPSPAVPGVPPAPNTQGLNAGAPAMKPAGTEQPSDVQKPWHQGVLRSIAESMAGGPNRQVVINDDGTRSVTYTHKSGKQIALGILAAAVEGALSGMDRRNEKYASAGSAFAKGGEATLAQQKELAQKQDQQAQADYARKLQTTETNLNMAHTVRSIGVLDQQLGKPLIDTAVPIINELDAHGAIKEHFVDENELLKKYHITKDQALPERMVPVIGANGEQAHNLDGTLKWKFQYAVIDPNVQATVPKDILDLAKKYNIPGWQNLGNNDQNPITKARLITDLYQRVSAIQAMQGVTQNIAKQQNAAANTETGNIWKLWTDPNTGLPDFDAMARKGIAVHEGFGAKADNRPTRNHNPGDLMWAPWEQNVVGKDKDGFAIFRSDEDGFTALKTKLQNDYQRHPQGMEPQTYINSYYSPDNAPGNGAGQAQKYADDLVKLAGKTPTQPQPAIPPIDLQAFLTRPDGIANQKALQASLPYISQHADRPDLALAEMRQAQAKGQLTADTVGRMARMLTNNGQFDLDKWGKEQDNAVALAKQQQELQMREQEQKDMEEFKRGEDQKTAAQESAIINQGPVDYTPPDNWQQMTPQQLEQALRAKGITNLPTNLPAMLAIAKGDVKPTGFPQKTYKGTEGSVLNEQTALSFITKFINPQYNEFTYGQKQAYAKDLTNTAPGHAGFIRDQAGAVAEHLMLLKKASDAIGNGDLTDVNAILNKLGEHTGSDKQVAMQTVLRRVQSETEKLVTGNSPREAELQKAAEEANMNLSPAQLVNFINYSLMLANARVTEVNNDSNTFLGHDIQLSEQAARGFGSIAPHTYVPGWGYSILDPNSGKVLGFVKNPSDTVFSKKIQ